MDVLGPLTLRPGDRRIRAVVRGGPPAGDPWWVERSCARCGRASDAQSGALVVYGHHDSPAPETAALCPDCAARLTPYRFAVDLEGVSSIVDPDAICRELRQLVERVVAMRAEPPTDVMWIRARDVHALARRLATTRTHLGLHLQDLGTLAAVDVATEDWPGHARRTRRAVRAHV